MSRAYYDNLAWQAERDRAIQDGFAKKRAEERAKRQAKRESRSKTIEYMVKPGDGEQFLVTVKVDMGNGSPKAWSEGLNRGFRAAVSEALKRPIELHSVEFWKVV